MAKNKSPVKIETWKGKRVFVARKDGRIVSWRYVAKSNLTKREASQIFKENKTFNEDKKIVSIGRTSQIIISKSNTRQPKRFKQIGVSISWLNKRNRVIGVTEGYSMLLSKVDSTQEAKQQAYNMAKANATSEGLIRYDHTNYKINRYFYQTYISSYKAKT